MSRRRNRRRQKRIMDRCANGFAAAMERRMNAMALEAVFGGTTTYAPPELYGSVERSNSLTIGKLRQLQEKVGKEFGPVISDVKAAPDTFEKFVDETTARVAAAFDVHEVLGVRIEKNPFVPSGMGVLLSGGKVVGIIKDIK